jgi:hypothetical protein
MAGSSEHDNEPSGYMRERLEISWLAERLPYSQEGLCSTELVKLKQVNEAAKEPNPRTETRIRFAVSVFSRPSEVLVHLVVVAHAMWAAYLPVNIQAPLRIHILRLQVCPNERKRTRCVRIIFLSSLANFSHFPFRNRYLPEVQQVIFVYLWWRVSSISRVMKSICNASVWRQRRT